MIDETKLREKVEKIVKGTAYRGMFIENIINDIMKAVKECEEKHAVLD